MKYLYLLRESAAYVVSRLCFSRTCMLCHRPAVYQPLCHDCRCRLSAGAAAALALNRCQYCGRPLISEHQVCTICRKNDAVFRSPVISQPLPVFPYAGKKKQLLTEWKIAGDRSLSSLYGVIIASVLQEKYPGIPVVPVPPRRRKIREKGWDQIEDLCRYLEAVESAPVLRILERTAQVQQKTLNRQQRLAGLGAEYRLLPEQKLHRRLRTSGIPQEVVLLDDVITTGATVIAAAAALQQAGVEKVHPVSLFYVP